MSQTTTDRTRSVAARQQDDDDTVKAVAAVFDRQADRYTKLLPSHIKLEDFRNAFLTAVQRRPALLQADRNSFWLALQQCAADGLKADNREAALVIFADDEEDAEGNRVPSKSSKPKQVVYMPMTAGLRKLLRNTGQIRTIETELVYRGETVKIWREDGTRHFKHEVNTEPDADRSPQAIVGAYAVVVFKDGSWQAEWMSRSDIERVRAVSRAKSAKAPWQVWYDEMCRKTPLRRLAKQLDRSPEVAALQDVLDRDPTAGETIEGEAIEIASAVAAPPVEAKPAQTRRQPAPAAEDRPAPEDPDAFRREAQKTGFAAPGRPSASQPEEAQPPQAEAPTAPTDRQEVPHELAAPTPVEAWLVDADGKAVGQEPHNTPEQFALAIAVLCAKGDAEEVLRNNEGAIEEACDASEKARQIIEAIGDAGKDMQALPESAGGAGVAAVHDQRPGCIIPLPVPRTPGGAIHVPNYERACSEALATLASAAEVDAWVTRNESGYRDNLRAKTKIERLVRGARERVTPPTNAGAEYVHRNPMTAPGGSSDQAQEDHAPRPPTSQAAPAEPRTRRSVEQKPHNLPAAGQASGATEADTSVVESRLTDLRTFPSKADAQYFFGGPIVAGLTERLDREGKVALAAYFRREAKRIIDQLS